MNAVWNADALVCAAGQEQAGDLRRHSVHLLDPVEAAYIVLGVAFDPAVHPRHDRLEGCEPWALRTLHAHAGDPRPYCYSEAELEDARTHDRLWNAAQRQMVASGWMHGYLRMYWAKKILEWTRTPAEALEIALQLNDRYELDGRDPKRFAAP